MDNGSEANVVGSVKGRFDVKVDTILLRLERCVKT